MVPPKGVHRQPWRFKCNACSCLDQSYLLLNESQQKVQGNLLLSVTDFHFGGAGRVCFVTLLRLVFLELRFTELAEPAELEE